MAKITFENNCARENVGMMTPIGIAGWVKINGNVDEYNNSKSYTATISLTDEAAQELRSKLTDIWNNSECKKAWLEQAKTDEKTFEYLDRGEEPYFTLQKHEKYGWQLKTKTVIEWKTKNGTVPNIIKIKDADGNYMADDTKIWSGSKLSLFITCSPYFKATGEYGVSTKLSGIQVIELKQSTSANSDWGIKSSNNQASVDETIPF